ncbi:serine hydrolase [Winogradskyella sp.]|uniref:serine hydrolase n=1 Tax=Winogradskyella sp. TaxID=1883156 RepID=UPI002639E3FC|nr:serine hydrolase [Winogradskyella sp.]
MKKTLYTIVCLLLLFNCKEKEEEKNLLSPEALKIEETVLKQKELFDAPGIVIGMIKNDTIIYKGAHGVKSLNTKDSLTTTSLFHMASVSKPFVATAIVQLVEQGKVDLDEKLTHYLPYYTMADERYKDITIKQMLAHTSGIPNTGDYEWDKPQYDDGAAERYARSQKTEVLDFEPGTAYSYSNPAFDILCDVIAKASGMTFEDYMKQHIFEPIGMKNSTFFKPEVPKDLATQPHVFGDSLQNEVSDIYPYNRRHAGSSTLHSNVEDMLLWAQVYLNKGMINGKQIYSEASYELLTTVHTPKDERKVCLSWFPGRINESPIYYHNGQDTGFNSFFGFMPEKKSAIVMMTNTDYFWRQSNAAIILKNIIFNDTLRTRGPIHFKLKDYVLTDGIEKVKEVYFEEKQKSPQDYTFDSGGIDDLGYWLIDRNYLKEALEVFMFNTELEPEHAGWVDSVADAYKAMDSIDLAIKWYEKALEMKPDQDFSQKKLKELLESQPKG